MGSIIRTLDVVRSKAVTAWTAQSPRRSRNSHIKADRIIRVGELCYPGHTRFVQQHYGRFLPQDEAALAAKILNQVWEAA